MLHNLSLTNSILNQFVLELRSSEIQSDSMRFRRNLERIGEIAAYEISKTLPFKKQSVQTVLGTANTAVIADKPVIGTILRAGLPLHQGVLNYFDDADNAFISAYRKHKPDHSFEIQLEYCACPSLNGRVLIITDPMLATGASMVATIEQLKQFGTPREVHIVAAIAAQAGINAVQKALPSAQIWAAAVDEHLNDKAYIVPGLGDAGDLAFGQKMQS